MILYSPAFTPEDLDRRIRPTPPDISIVIPIHDEAENLLELHRRLLAILESAQRTWEVIFVDDGSRDDSPRLIRAFHEAERRVKWIALSRQFGHQPAITAGIHLAAGRCVIVLDGDLQDPPELIPQLAAKWDEGFPVVVAERLSRAENGARGIGFALFHPLFRRLTRLPGPDAGVFALMDRAVVEQFNKLPERNRFIPGLRSWLGFRQASIPYDRQPRRAGRSKQPLGQLVKYALDALIGFSQLPLRCITYAGLLITGVAFALAVWQVVACLMHRGGPVPVTLLIVLFLGGVQLLALGILGAYIGRIYEELQQRPLYVVREMCGFERAGDSDCPSENAMIQLEKSDK